MVVRRADLVVSGEVVFFGRKKREGQRIFFMEESVWGQNGNPGGWELWDNGLCDVSRLGCRVGFVDFEKEIFMETRGGITTLR